MWHTQTAAVTGRGHLRQGLPCQDRTWSLSRNGVTAIALADGAGSAPLSHEGAACAVQTVCGVLCERFDALSTAATPLDMRRAVLEPVRQSIQARANALNVSARDLACTLLAVAVKGDAYLIFHVGDGVIGYQKAGKLLVASAPQNGEFANTTTFVTSPDALKKSRVLRGTQAELEGFVLMSDGCEAALYQKRKRSLAILVKRLFQRTAMFSPEAGEAHLTEMLETIISARTQDDCSLALLTRQPEPLKAWYSMTQRDKAAILGVATQNRNRRRRMIRQYARKYGVAQVDVEQISG
jgi:hypothetical protein